MKKITLLCAVFAFTFSYAQHTFPTITGPVNVVEGAAPTLNINDVANAAGAPAAGNGYDTFTVTADWAAGAGGPYSSEADLTVVTTAGSVLIDPATSGSAGNGDNTTLTFSGTFTSPYFPEVDGFLDVIPNQSWSGSDADWSNITVTINPAPLCTVPVATATVVEDCVNAQFSIDVDVTSLGDASSVTIVNNAGVASTTVSATGMVTVGPFQAGPGGVVSLTLEHDGDSQCNVDLGLYDDTCTGLPPVTVATFDISGCGDSDTTTTSQPGGAVVWVELIFDGNCNLVIVDTESSTSADGTLDTEIGLYDSTGALIGNDDDGGTGVLSSFTGTGLAAGTYYIAASTFNTTFGATDFGVTTSGTEDGDFTINANSVIANDDCANAEALTLGVVVNADNTGASDSMVTGDCFTGDIRDLWYSFVATSTETIYIATSAAQYGVYSDCAGTQVGTCNTSPITGLTDGNTYYIRVNDDGTTTRNPGAFTLLADQSQLSTNEFENQSSFTYYPNPVDNTLNLNAQNNIQNVVIYNILGQEVIRTNPNNINTELDMSGLQSGPYFVKVTIQDVTKTVRIIKQ